MLIPPQIPSHRRDMPNKARVIIIELIRSAVGTELLVFQSLVLASTVYCVIINILELYSISILGADNRFITTTLLSLLRNYNNFTVCFLFRFSLGQIYCSKCVCYGLFVCDECMYACRFVSMPMLFKSRNGIQIKGKCKISMLFLDKNFLFFQMVDLFLVYV